MIARSVLAALLGFAALSGCSPGASTIASQPDQGVVVPTHRTGTWSDAALSVGQLERRGDCFYLRGDLVIWPQDTAVVFGFPQVTVGSNRVVVHEGDTLKVGGGSYTRFEDLPGPILTGRPACPGPYFWATTVLSVTD